MLIFWPWPSLRAKNDNWVDFQQLSAWRQNQATASSPPRGADSGSRSALIFTWEARLMPLLLNLGLMTWINANDVMKSDLKCLWPLSGLPCAAAGLLRVQFWNLAQLPIESVFKIGFKTALDSVDFKGTTCEIISHCMYSLHNRSGPRYSKRWTSAGQTMI